jgi:hypothetical protein
MVACDDMPARDNPPLVEVRRSSSSESFPAASPHPMAETSPHWILPQGSKTTLGRQPTPLGPAAAEPVGPPLALGLRCPSLRWTTSCPSSHHARRLARDDRCSSIALPASSSHKIDLPPPPIQLKFPLLGVTDKHCGVGARYHKHSVSMVTSSPKRSGEAPRETRDCYPVQPPGGPHLNARARRFRQDPHPARVTDGRYPVRRLPDLSHFIP